MKIIDKRQVILFLIGVSFCFMTNAQTTIILQPAGAEGKDAYIDSRLNTGSFGEHNDFPSLSWTNGGVPVDGRALIDFDLCSIPAGATINSAHLSLYSYTSLGNGEHSTRSGSNESVLKRITTPWSENTVSWDNQPSTTTQNQVFLPSSTDFIQDYLDIDVTDLIIDTRNDPNNSHGFLLKLVTEEYYRRMIFASSDNPDSTLHPKLEITYTFDNCLVLRPAGLEGKDAYIDSRLNTGSFGEHNDFPSLSWTNGGVPVDGRALIDFDLCSIPAGATINSAHLSLYSYTSLGNGEHSIRSGSNESVLKRITTPWSENTVSWDNQPSTTTQNQVFLPPSTDFIQDYLDIDVTDLIIDTRNDPNNSYGFLLKLVTEEYYRRMIFASSDNPDSTLHPKLEVCYSMISSASENINNKIEFNLFPNPASNFITIDIGDFYQGLVSIDIISSAGQLIKRQFNVNPRQVIDVSNCAKGVYFVQIYFEDIVSTKKIIIE